MEAIRALMVAKRSARAERTQTIGQARSLILTGPEDLRARFAGYPAAGLVAGIALLRPEPGDAALVADDCLRFRTRCKRRVRPGLAGPHRNPTNLFFRRAHHGKPTDETGLRGTRRHSRYDGIVGPLTSTYAGELGCHDGYEIVVQGATEPLKSGRSAVRPRP